TAGATCASKATRWLSIRSTNSTGSKHQDQANPRGRPHGQEGARPSPQKVAPPQQPQQSCRREIGYWLAPAERLKILPQPSTPEHRSEEHTSELQSPC